MPELGESLAGRMYSLYRRHYAGSTEARFVRDLEAKTHAVLLTDARGNLAGFTTIEVYLSRAAATPTQVMYSGDTIVEPEHWGSPVLASTWLGFAGQVHHAAAGARLYWLLIVKGHRTYRFLSAFARRYLPHHRLTPRPLELELRNALAREKFGPCFDPRLGLVRYGAPLDRLQPALAAVPKRHRRLPAVAYFLERNPTYHRGDELVCLCELCPDNLKPRAARAFETRF